MGFGQSSHESNVNAYIVNGATDDTGRIVIRYEDSFFMLFDDDNGWDNFVNLVSRMIGHELVHRRQIDNIRRKHKDGSVKFYEIISKIGGNPDNIVKYMSRPAELMAFAYEAAEHLVQAGYSKENIKDLIKHPFQKEGAAREESDIFYSYTEWFDIKDPVFKKFSKYMYDYIDKKFEIPVNKKSQYKEELTKRKKIYSLSVSEIVNHYLSNNKNKKEALDSISSYIASIRDSKINKANLLRAKEIISKK